MEESREREDIAALLTRVLRENEHKGLTQKRIAEASGIPFQTISAWKSGRRKPSLGARGRDQLRELAKALPGVEVVEVFEAAGATVPGELDPEAEKRHMLIYRSLSPGRRRLADKVVEVLAAEER